MCVLTSLSEGVSQALTLYLFVGVEETAHGAVRRLETWTPVKLTLDFKAAQNPFLPERHEQLGPGVRFLRVHVYLHLLLHLCITHTHNYIDEPTSMEKVWMCIKLIH